MRSIFIIGGILVVLGIGSAVGFKFLIEPRLAEKSTSEGVLERKEPAPDASGFAVDSASPTPAPTGTQAASSTPTLTVTTRYDRKAVFLTFENLAAVASIDYSVLYVAKGVSKGVKGTIVRSQGEATLLREILLGTCSGAVCTYDEGVTTATVSATFVFENKSQTTISKTHTL